MTTLVVDVRSSEQVAVIQKTLLSTSVFHKDGSVLGPKAFLEYAEAVAHLMEGLQYHLVGDDMHGQKHGRPADVPAIISALEDCATDVSAWCAEKRLQLNAEKTEVLCNVNVM